MNMEKREIKFRALDEMERRAIKSRYVTYNRSSKAVKKRHAANKKAKKARKNNR